MTMQPRRWLGLALVIAFLPGNAPLLRMFVELPISDTSQILLVFLLFITGLLLLVFPTRAEAAERARARAGDDDE